MLTESKNNSTNPNCSVVYFGTPSFSASVLDALVQTRYKPQLVVTMPDKKQGRAQVLAPPPVKLVAQQHNIPVVQPATLDSNFELEKEYDLFLVFAYGLLIPQRILEMPKHGAVNVHASLLPQYRGASPVQHALLSGDATTGITLMLMDQKMDHGPIIAQHEISIDEQETYATLIQKIAQQTTPLLQTTLPKWLSGEIQPTPQNHANATYTSMLTTQDARIDWNNSAQRIERMVRAFNPKPGAFTFWNNKRLKIMRAELTTAQSSLPFGTVSVENNNLLIACNDLFLKINDLQLEGQNIKTTHQFLQAHDDIQGGVLG